jgi:hypothetical protein
MDSGPVIMSCTYVPNDSHKSGSGSETEVFLGEISDQGWNEVGVRYPGVGIVTGWVGGFISLPRDLIQ